MYLKKKNFITMSKLCNFADDNTLYNSSKELQIVFRSLETDLSNVFAWFNINSLKANPDNFQFMVWGTKENDSFVLNMSKNKIES